MAEKLRWECLLEAVMNAKEGESKKRKEVEITEKQSMKKARKEAEQREKAAKMAEIEAAKMAEIEAAREKAAKEDEEANRVRNLRIINEIIFPSMHDYMISLKKLHADNANLNKVWQQKEALFETVLVSEKQLFLCKERLLNILKKECGDSYMTAFEMLQKKFAEFK
jgi:hypothetical protein